MKRLTLCLLVLCPYLFVRAGERRDRDSLYPSTPNTLLHPASTNFGQRVDKLSSTRLYSMAFVGAPLVVGGIIVKGEDRRFRHLRNDYLPRFNRHVDDYMQYLPAAVMLGMKAAGVSGRSSWGRMLAADAFSAVIMGSVVNTLKHTTSVERPDGSNRHSFPSGHTATAFMTATMLNKEYGNRYPWLGIGAYGVATATGLMRMANNKHWLSDVLTGAGIGILSAELGYFLSDLLLGSRGLHTYVDSRAMERTDRPSFVGLYLGMNVPLSGYDIDEQTEFRTSSGSTVGVEGAYYFSPYVGIGGRLTASSTSIIVGDTQAEAHTFDASSACVGGYFSVPLSVRWSLGSKLLAGYVHYPALELTDTSVSARGGMSFGSGLSLSFRAKRRYALRLFLDYNLMPSHSRTTREYMNTLTVGTALALNL